MGPNRELRHGYGSLSGTLASSLTTKKRLAYNVSPDHRIATAYITRAVQPLTSCVSFSPPSTLRLQIFEPKEKEKKKIPSSPHSPARSHGCAFLNHKPFSIFLEGSRDRGKHTGVALPTMTLFILTETSAGYALLKAKDKKLLKRDDLDIPAEAATPEGVSNLYVSF